jgi:hypothetical protein
MDKDGNTPIKVAQKVEQSRVAAQLIRAGGVVFNALLGGETFLTLRVLPLDAEVLFRHSSGFARAQFKRAPNC